MDGGGQVGEEEARRAFRVLYNRDGEVAVEAARKASFHFLFSLHLDFHKTPSPFSFENLLLVAHGTRVTYDLGFCGKFLNVCQFQEKAISVSDQTRDDRFDIPISLSSQCICKPCAYVQKTGELTRLLPCGHVSSV